MNINSIARENGVYSINDPSVDFQLARDEYYFCGYQWGQLFFFRNNSLCQIKLIHPWEDNCYVNTVQKIGQTCSIIYIESNQTYCDIFNGHCSGEIEDENDFRNIVTEIESEGLKNDKLILYYIDNWIIDYFGNLNDDIIENIDNKDSVIINLHDNARLIQVMVDNNDIIVDFIHPSILRHSSF